MTELATRLATSEDVPPLYNFLRVIAQPVLHAPIDARESITEIERVIRDDFALVVTADGEIVGSLGMLGVKWWYAKRARFLTDRWYFVYPEVRKAGAGAALLGAAGGIAHASSMDILINGHAKRRNTGAGRGVLFTKPQFIAADDMPATDWSEVDRNVVMET